LQSTGDGGKITQRGRSIKERRSWEDVMNSCLAGISLIALSAAVAVPAAAQEVRGPESPRPTSTNVAPAPVDSTEPAEGTAALGEIIVTARKIAENLQDVPIAVTAFSGEDLQQQSARSVIDIAKLTPGLLIRQSTNSESTATFAIRGQVQTDVLATVDPSVGVYVDGYYWARAQGINADLLDLQSVQVLKGPQGTLFGRNTTGGAILIQTNDPNFEGLSGLSSVTFGRFNERSGTAIVNLPIVDEKMALRLAVQRNKRDGYITNLFDGSKLANRNSWTARGKLLFYPTERLRVLLTADYFRSKTRQRPYILAQISPNLGAAQIGFENGATTFPTAIATGTAVGNNLIALLNQDLNTSSIKNPANSFAKTYTYTGTAAYETGYGEIKIVNGYRRVRGANGLDLDGTPFTLLGPGAGVDFNGFQRIHQYASELQTTGRALDDRLDFAAGLFYFHEAGRDTARTQSVPAVAGSPTVFNRFDGQINHDSKGVYGQTTWHVTDALGITGGLRYSSETKALTIRNRREANPTTFTCTVAGTMLPECALSRKDKFSSLSYTFGVDYKVSEDVMVYAKTAKGFRSGGQNLRATAATNFIPFGPEKAFSYEAGFKSELFDRRVRLNVAAYYTRINGIQRSVAVPTNPPATLVQNAGKARVLGGEADLAVVPVEGLTLSATGSITKPKYLEYFDGPKDRRTDRFETIPEYSFTLSGTYKTDIGVGELLVRGDFIRTGKYFVNSYNEVTNPLNSQIIAATTAPASSIFNAMTSLTMLDKALEIALWGRNLSNNRDSDAGLLLPPGATSLGFAVINRREPRTFGVTGTFRFGQ
jgi:iron complex outermembrane receptor protein